jgi:hypothetical protein
MSLCLLADHESRFVAAAEDLTTEYRFGVYDILFLPESFPYGGKFRSARFLPQLTASSQAWRTAV